MRYDGSTLARVYFDRARNFRSGAFVRAVRSPPHQITTAALTFRARRAAFAWPLREGIVADLDAFRAAVRHSLTHPTLSLIVYVLFYVGLAVLIYLMFDRAMMTRSDGIYTGVLNNFGDLPFHLSVVSGFAFGNNYPPEDPTYAGVRFTYPFLSDFISAVFVRCGASLRASLFIENFFLAVGFVGVLHALGRRSCVTSCCADHDCVIFNGFGTTGCFRAPKNQRGL